MHVEFDPTKAAANLKKHGISFSDAELVLYDPMALTNEDDATHWRGAVCNGGRRCAKSGVDGGMDAT